jgi:hypothetical protein
MIAVTALSLTRAIARVQAVRAALNRAAGFDSPSTLARKRPSFDAGAFFTPGASALGPALRRLPVNGGRRGGAFGLAGANCRSVNPASSATSGDSAVADSTDQLETTTMSTASLAARARPSNVIPFPSQRSRRVVPAPADFDPFDHGIALAARECSEALLADGWNPREAYAFVAGFAANCNAIIAEETRGGAL